MHNRLLQSHLPNVRKWYRQLQPDGRPFFHYFVSSGRKETFLAKHITVAPLKRLSPSAPARGRAQCLSPLCLRAVGKVREFEQYRKGTQDSVKRPPIHAVVCPLPLMPYSNSFSRSSHCATLLARKDVSGELLEDSSICSLFAAYTNWTTLRTLAGTNVAGHGGVMNDGDGSREAIASAMMHIPTDIHDCLSDAQCTDALLTAK